MKRRSAAERLYQGIACVFVIGCLCLCACASEPSSAASAEAGASDDAASAPDDTIAAGAKQESGLRLRLPEASGTVVYEGEGVTIDASNTGEGYVMIKSAPSKRRLKVCVSAQTSTYYYDLPSDGAFQTYPLQMGSGAYTVRVMENVERDLYAVRYAVELTILLADEKLPFLYPSQYVDFDADSAAVAASNELSAGLTEPKRVANKLYRFVAGHISYDAEKARTVENGYLPDADETLGSGKGICFDYSVLLAVMLRAQGIPAKVEIGYVSPERLYHAWNRVYLDGRWVLFDATLDGTGHRAADYAKEREY